MNIGNSEVNGATFKSGDIVMTPRGKGKVVVVHAAPLSNGKIIVTYNVKLDNQKHPLDFMASEVSKCFYDTTNKTSMIE